MERTGVVTFQGGPLTLVGPEIRVGQKAPDFTVCDAELAPVSMKDFAGKVKLISVTPSLDTPVCDIQAKRFNTEAAKLGDEIVVMNISVDLPFAIARFCSASGIDRIRTLSDHRDLSFGNAYGVVIKELRLLSRAIFVVGKDDTVAYAEYVGEITEHPNYDAALDTAKKLA
jgi:thiol peroxidase